MPKRAEPASHAPPVRYRRENHLHARLAYRRRRPQRHQMLGHAYVSNCTCRVIRHNEDPAETGDIAVPNTTANPAPTALTAIDAKFLRMAYQEAKAGFDEGGCPIGSVIAEGERLVSRGRNQRVQGGDPIAHGEMDALRKAGRQKSYRKMTLYTSLSPCMMCTGTIIQFGIPRVIVGENKNFLGAEDLFAARGVKVSVLQDPDCIALMERFVREKPDLWNEDIGR